VHINQEEGRNAYTTPGLRTLKTASHLDIFAEGSHHSKVVTKEFAQAVWKLGKTSGEVQRRCLQTTPRHTEETISTIAKPKT